MSGDINFYNKLGKRIAYFRKEKGIKQIDFSYSINMDDGSLRRIESGRTKANIQTIRRIADGLNIHIKELFDFEYD
jgi:transcriptional regulator with XRE-family HTH domain